MIMKMMENRKTERAHERVFVPPRIGEKRATL